MQMKKHVDLTPFNTMATRSVAEYYCRVETVEQLMQAVELAKEQALPILLLGGGSNVILPPVISGVVIHIAIMGRQVDVIDHRFADFTIGAGESWHELVLFSLKQGYRGLENLSLIPGTVGAAPIQNIGAYGAEIKESLQKVSVLDLDNLQEKVLPNQALNFGYRDSLFKQQPNRYVVTSVTLRLDKEAPLKTAYGDLQLRLTAEVDSAVEVSRAVIEARQSKLPDYRELPNAGSFFKNPIVDQEHFSSLQALFPNIVYYDLGGGQFKLAAAWLIQEAGWKGYSDDRVGVHEKQALVLINHNHGNSDDILNLAQKIKCSVQEKFSVNLEIEPVIVG